MGFRGRVLLNAQAFCALMFLLLPLRIPGQSSEPAPPTIRYISPSQTVNGGSSAYFSVDAISYVPPQYQWQFNGEDIPGATNSSLYLTRVDDTHEGSYRVRVSNPAGEALSQESFLTVIIAPADIIAQPTNRTALMGQYVSFSVGAAGLPSPSFQWFFNREPIPNATSNIFFRARASVDDAGSYSVLVSNKYGSRMSDSASLTVSPGEYHAGSVDLDFDAGQEHYGYPWADYYTVGPIGLLPNGNLAAAGYFRGASNYLQTVGIVGPNGKSLQDFGSKWVAPGGIDISYLQTARDGSMLAATKFTFGSNEMVRLEADGTPSLRLSRMNMAISPFGMQPNGAIIGAASVEGVSVFALNADGTQAYQPFNFPEDPPVDGAKPGGPHNYYGAVQPDGKFLFWSEGRYLRHGAKDLSFYGKGFAGPVLRFQPDGRILGGGNFTNVFGLPRNALVRMLPDGSLDQTFDAQFQAGTDVKDVAVEPSGRIVVVGNLRRVGQTNTYQILRLEPDGSLDGSFDAGAASDGSLRSVVVQSDGEIIVGGRFQLFNNYLRPGLVRLYGDEAGPPRISEQPRSQNVQVARAVQFAAGVVCYPLGTFQWRFNGSNIAGATTRVLEFTNVQSSAAGDYDLIISNSFGSITSAVASLTVESAPNVAGTVDADFFPGSGADNIVYDVAVQPDGKMIIVGSFREVQGTIRNQVARLNPDGSLDVSFAAADLKYSRYYSNPAVNIVELCSDGKVLIAGGFTNINGQTAKGIARLNSDGTVENTFPGLIRNDPGSIDGLNAIIADIDGRFLIGGFFQSSVTNRYISLARFNADGTPDYSFTPLVSDAILSMSLQPDGKVLASTAGGFYTYPGVRRFLENGARDLSFSNLQVSVTSIVPRGDGRTLVSGANFVALLDNNGRFDNGFSVPIFAEESEIHGIALHDCDKILVYGSLKLFNDPGGAYHLLRLNSDGHLDLSFPLKRFDGLPRCMAVQRDGQIIIGGEFSQIDGVRRDSIVRLHGGMTEPPPIFAQPQSQNVAAGQDVSFEVAVPECTQLFFQWQLNGTNIPGATNQTLRLENVRARQIGEYRVVVNFGTGTNVSEIASLNVTPERHEFGTPDIDFYPGRLEGGAVRSLIRDQQGNLLIGGAFEKLGNRTGRFVARLNPEGGYDSSFNPSSRVSGQVDAIAVQADGKLIVGGLFTNSFGNPGGVARLFYDGSLDSSFFWNREWMRVKCFGFQSNGKLLLGGQFALGYGVFRVFESDGRPETFFGVSGGDVFALARQRAGKTVIGGSFSRVGGSERNRIARLLDDGPLDSLFNPPLAQYGSVLALAVDQDDRIWVGGDFVLSTLARSRISRLNADGTLDSTFDAGEGPNGAVYALLPQPNGKVLIGGAFTTVNGIACGHIARLNKDGSLDSTFVAQPGADDTVYAFAPDVTGKVYIGGAFSHVNGYERDRVARLNNDPLLFQPQFTLNGGFQVSLFTFAGQNYVLEFKSSLDQADWGTAAMILGDGTVRTLSDRNTQDSQRFYRVRME